jgi:hypothetical protein
VKVFYEETEDVKASGIFSVVPLAYVAARELQGKKADGEIVANLYHGVAQANAMVEARGQASIDATKNRPHPTDLIHVESATEPRGERARGVAPPPMPADTGGKGGWQEWWHSYTAWFND